MKMKDDRSIVNGKNKIILAKILVECFEFFFRVTKNTGVLTVITLPTEYDHSSKTNDLSQVSVDYRVRSTNFTVYQR